MATVKLFGAFQDVAGWGEREIDVSTLGEVMTQVAAGDRGLEARLLHPSALVIVNATLMPHSLRDPDHPVAPSDEIAFGPAVSGG